MLIHAAGRSGRSSSASGRCAWPGRSPRPWPAFPAPPFRRRSVACLPSGSCAAASYGGVRAVWMAAGRSCGRRCPANGIWAGSPPGEPHPAGHGKCSASSSFPSWAAGCSCGAAGGADTPGWRRVRSTGACATARGRARRPGRTPQGGRRLLASAGLASSITKTGPEAPRGGELPRGFRVYSAGEVGCRRGGATRPGAQSR